jgi:RNA-splicing ligase RtcB
MTEKPHEQPSEEASGQASERPPLADQIKAKMDEYEVDRHLEDIAATLEHAVRTGLSMAGEFAHEHRDDIERLIDKAASAVDRHTDGRHADKVQQVRGSLGRGVEKLADQREDGTPDVSGSAGSDIPPSNG